MALADLAPSNPTASRLGSRLAGLVALVTFVLLLSGGQVTSHDVGMADPYWRDIQVRFWLADSVGLMIEHRHRFMGAAVGLLAIGLTIASWRSTRLRPLRWWATATLLAIIAQGVLGGSRIELNKLGIGRELAAFHGVFAQCCFALIVTTWLLFRRQRQSIQAIDHQLADSVKQGSLVLAGLLFAQVVLGAAQRHLGKGVELHILGAVGIVMTILYLAFVVLLDPQLKRSVGHVTQVLFGLVVVQIGLGIATYFMTDALPPGMGTTPTTIEAGVATLHMATGSLMIAATASLVLRSLLDLRPLPMPALAEVTS